MRNDFHLEIRRLFALTIACLFIGLLTSNVLVVLLLGSLLYIIWTLFQIRQLENWLRNSRLSSIPDASGIWGNIFDSLSREKKRQLREKKRYKKVINRVETMTASLNDAIILLDADHTITWLNKSSRTMLALKKADVGSPITNLIRNPIFVSYLAQDDHELPLILPSNNNIEQRLEYRINYFGNNEVLLIVRDVTRLYRLEQMRKDFVANVSHELRTPLTVIGGYLETMNDYHSLEESWKKPLEQMQQQAKRMTVLINDLTMLSKLETEELNKAPISVPVRPLLEMIINEARTISDKKEQTVELECTTDFNILGNDRELHSAFSNLIMNAIRYSPAKKNIIVKASHNFTGGADVKVIDKGIGIEQHHIHRLTERFYRVDSSRSIETGGTGLGLAIVKHILVRHDARLNISSRINQGSTFSAIFPKERIEN